MLTYNTQLKELILPEYGRNIQQMIDYCLSIPDREERTVCAYSIVTAMANLFPQLRENPDYRRQLWDHLAIMSDFQLDIDYPYEIIKPDSLDTKPQHVGYTNTAFRYRHYGDNLEKMVNIAAEMPEGPERDALAILLANHMKKLMLAVNPDGVDDAKVFKDLAQLTHGAIRLDPATHKLHEFSAEIVPATSGKKKKKKKK